MAEQVETKTLAQVIKDAISSQLLDLHVCLPARVEKYNKALQMADIKPLIRRKIKIGDGSIVDLPVITGVPVQWQSANEGKSFIHLPLKKDDLGMAIFCERSLDRWVVGEGYEVTPDDPRHHDLSDAIFIPGLQPWKKALDVPNANNLYVKNENASLELYPSGKIKLSGNSNELVAILSDILNHLINAKVLTAIGLQPFIATTIASLTSDKTKIDNLKA